MTYKLLPTWQHVKQLADKILILYREIETAGSPPTGVEGKRIVRAYRSEMDRKSKHQLDELRRKVVQHLENQNQFKLEKHLKYLGDKYDVEIDKIKTYMASKGNFSREDRERFRHKIREVEQMKKDHIRKDREYLNMRFSKELKLRADHMMKQFIYKLAPQGFHFRLKYAMDTYGGRAYAGSMVISADRENRGEWKKILSFTAPRK